MQKAVREAVVVVIKPVRLSGIVLLVATFPLQAATLPEERADLMYHSYDGGGMTIDGPSLLVRKNFKETYSLSANYYVDNVSSASIDVIASGASTYSEQRDEFSVTASYLQDKTLLNGGYTNSSESDYDAETFYFDINQNFFGDLTTLTLGYSRGSDEVRQNGNEDFSDEVTRQNFRFGISQILTPRLMIGLNYEAITEEGYLNNPYRSYRFLTNPLDIDAGYQTATEVYPRTRTSDAATLSASYFLPYRAALKAEYRYYTDDWDIDAHTYKLSYTHTFGERWILDIKYRGYSQSNAYFYNDLFNFSSLDEKDFKARDKELSEFSSQTFGIALSYDIPLLKERKIIDHGSISLQWDHLIFDYDNFRDITENGIAGEESLYSFDADVIRLFISLWY